MAVTLDDAMGVLFFDIAVTIIKSTINELNMNFLESFFSFSKELLLSFIVGSLLGLLISRIVKFLKNNEEILIVSIAFIVLGVSFAQQFNLSPLLVNIILEATFANFSLKSENVLEMLKIGCLQSF